MCTYFGPKKRERKSASGNASAKGDDSDELGPAHVTITPLLSMELIALMSRRPDARDGIFANVSGDTTSNASSIDFPVKRMSLESILNPWHKEIISPSENLQGNGG